MGGFLLCFKRTVFSIVLLLRVSCFVVHIPVFDAEDHWLKSHWGQTRLCTINMHYISSNCNSTIFVCLLALTSQATTPPCIRLYQNEHNTRRQPSALEQI